MQNNTGDKKGVECKDYKYRSKEKYAERWTQCRYQSKWPTQRDDSGCNEQVDQGKEKTGRKECQDEYK